ncbi:hypothetical protein, partial [Companilactobacillus paralimentarius]|uniref:hypothetical protein n=1 Tax=Companilactobacillus paralimentarius TaxID=83526 RepID=UPI001F438D28
VGLHNFSVKTLFSFQRSTSRLSAYAYRRLNYFIKSVTICQEPFKIIIQLNEIIIQLSMRLLYRDNK